jgi:hypothetical protein
MIANVRRFLISSNSFLSDINTYLRYLSSLQTTYLQARFVTDKHGFSAQIYSCDKTLDTAWNLLARILALYNA